MSKPERASYWNGDIMRAGYVGKLRARDPRELLSTHRGLCAVVAIGGIVLVTSLDLSDHKPLRQHLGTYAFLATLGFIAITAHLALQPAARLRPIAALRGHALALFGIGAALLANMTDIALFSPTPYPSYRWPPFLTALLFTYSVALIAATWLTTPARHLSTVIGSLAIAWEVYLAFHMIVLPLL